jgi:hypothetical protein
MGVLDDAIREHLELKRQHGASEGEVEQQEQEALGAPRGRPAEAAEESAVEESAPAAEDEPPVEEPEVESEPEEPTYEAEVADPAPESGGDTPPRGFERVEDVAPPADGDDEEDVLEETPDFLQETPEHDRLWFEQKPPRDFDFDDDK